MNDFGIIITCYIGDYFLTKGLLASINTFMPHIPICIIQDGDFSIDAERKMYNISHVIKKADVKNDFLRENCFGSRCTNMIAFWESPFKRFLYIDSDTIIRGDVTKNFEYTKYDFIHNIPHEEYTDFVIKHQYFNFEKLFTIIPEIAFRNHHFFNAGVFVATRGMFDLELFKNLLAIWKTDKKLFGPEPQGFINYMVFRLVEEQKITVGEAALQTLVPMFDKTTLEKMYALQETEQATIVHWAGMKPLYINRNKVYSRIALHYRKQNLRDKKSIGMLFPALAFLMEESKNLLRIYFKSSLKSFVMSKIKQIYVLNLRNKLHNLISILFPKNINYKRTAVLKYCNKSHYPTLIEESEIKELTITKRLSIARFSADEFKLCFDIDTQNQVHDKELRYRFRNILLQTQNPTCLLSVPRIEKMSDNEIENLFPVSKYLKEILNCNDSYHTHCDILACSEEYGTDRNIVFITNSNTYKLEHSKAQSVKTITKDRNNIWNLYNPIKKEIITETSVLKNPLVIVNLGVISGILVYDLSRLGIQVMDIH